MTNLRRRLTIPLQPLQVRERVTLACPAMIHAADRPPLLSYSDAGFIEAFLSLANRDQPVADQELPPLLAWRDWSEPPQAMLNAQGQVVYPAALIRRGPPLGLRDPLSSGASDRRDADGIPAAELATDPPWLRKLYLPQHERFTLVCVDAICDRYGQPSLDRRRVKQAGMVVRRLKPGADPATEHWEDWFPSGEGEGSWQELYDAEFHLLGSGGPLAVGLDPVEAGLQSHPLRLIPDNPDPKRLTPCRLYGYLPVWSAERQRRADPAARIAARQAIKLQRLAEFQTSWDQLGGQPQPLLELFRLTLLPDQGVPAAAVATPQELDALLAQAIHRLAKAGLDAKRFAKDVSGACADGSALWTGAGSESAANLAAEWLQSKQRNPAAAPALDALLRQRLHRAVETHLTQPATSGLSATQWSLLLAAALVRARGHLLALARAIEWSLAAAQPGFSSGAEDKWLASLPGQAAAGARPARPGAAVHSLGGLLEWGALFRQADGTVRVAEQSLSISNAGLTQRIQAVLSHLLALQAPLIPVARQLGAAGASVRAALAERGRAMESDLLKEVAIDPTTTDLASLGVPLDESPAEGLLVAPGLHPTTADLQALLARSQVLDGAGSKFSAAAGRAEEVATELRYDSQHLYAVWCWVRVGGRSPCEREQLIWSKRSEPFRIAEPQDLLGVRPVSLPMPDLPRLLKDMGRVIQARARPFAAVRTPPQSGFEAKDLSTISRRMGWGGSCSFGIPVFTICALVMFSIVFAILSLVLRWLPLLQICTPNVDESSGP